MTKIKICGIFRKEDAVLINKYKPDYFGMVIDFEKSHRGISARFAALIRSLVDKSIPAVGVFVDKDISEIADFLNGGIIDIAQLHGNETREDIEKLKNMSKRPVWKAFKIRNLKDVKKAEESPADLVVLDNGRGTGRTFDWDLIRGMKRKFALAGGLELNNLQNAIDAINPYMVDISSGVETGKIKDEYKIMQSVNIAHCLRRREDV